MLAVNPLYKLDLEKAFPSTIMSSYNKDKIELISNYNHSLIFYKNSEYFYVITEKTYINNYKNKLEVILSNVSDNIFTALKIEDNFFEFNDSTGEPIINVNSIISRSAIFLI